MGFVSVLIFSGIIFTIATGALLTSTWSHGTVVSNMAYEFTTRSYLIPICLLLLGYGLYAVTRKKNKMKLRIPSMILLLFSITLALFPVVYSAQKEYSLRTADITTVFTREHITPLLRYSILKAYTYDREKKVLHLSFEFDPVKLRKLYQSTNSSNDSLRDHQIRQALNHDIYWVNQYLWNSTKAQKLVHYSIYSCEQIVYDTSVTSIDFAELQEPYYFLSIREKDGKFELIYHRENQKGAIPLEDY